MKASASTGRRSRCASNAGSLGYRLGFTVMVEASANSQVRPSGFAAATALAPIRPLAPARFSTTTFSFVCSATACVITRVIASRPPPGGKGTIARVCAFATMEKSKRRTTESVFMRLALVAEKPRDDQREPRHVSNQQQCDRHGDV